MPIFNRRRKQQRNVAFYSLDDFENVSVSGYTRLDKRPEIVAGVRRMSELISSMTIHLMANRKGGDERIVNELSRKVDIDPIGTMTRKHWMDAIVMNLLLYGQGNSVVKVHTSGGLIGDLEPIAADRVSFQAVGEYQYRVLINGIPYDPDDLLHFTHNPDKTYLWKGQGLKVSLADVAGNLAQAAETEKGFMKSKWKPSLIVKVDALADEFASPEGRERLLDSYAKPKSAGDPWIIPAEQFDVKEVRPLSLADLAINESVTLNKRTVASILGVPPFVLGVGEYNAAAWNSFVSNTIRPICREIEQELTRKLLISPTMYFRFNIQSMMDYDIKTLADVFGNLSDKGIITGNEVRDRLGMSPLDGLDDLRLLENYIPLDRLGDQKKLLEVNDNGN